MSTAQEASLYLTAATTATPGAVMTVTVTSWTSWTDDTFHTQLRELIGICHTPATHLGTIVLFSYTVQTPT